MTNVLPETLRIKGQMKTLGKLYDQYEGRVLSYDDLGVDKDAVGSKEW